MGPTRRVVARVATRRIHKILQLRTEDDLLAFVREYGVFARNTGKGLAPGGGAPVGRPPWPSANAEMRDGVQRSSASVNVLNPRLERVTAFGSGDVFFGDGLLWSAVARDFGGIEIFPYRYDALHGGVLVRLKHCGIKHESA